MTHFTALVIVKNLGDVDEVMAPFSEHITVAPYISRTKDEILAERNEFIDVWEGYLQEDGGKNPEHCMHLRNSIKEAKNMTDEEHGYQYIEKDDLDSEGNELSTYNPDSKWDWYSEGGRWADEIIIGNITQNPNDIKMPTYSVVRNNKWYQRGEMGWFGMAADEIDEADWDEQFWSLVNMTPKGYYFVQLDCHI